MVLNLRAPTFQKLFFHTEYFINPHKLESVDSFIDLEELFDQKLRLNLHIELSKNVSLFVFRQIDNSTKSDLLAR